MRARISHQRPRGCLRTNPPPGPDRRVANRLSEPPWRTSIQPTIQPTTLTDSIASTSQARRSRLQSNPTPPLPRRVGPSALPPPPVGVEDVRQEVEVMATAQVVAAGVDMAPAVTIRNQFIGPNPIAEVANGCQDGSPAAVGRPVASASVGSRVGPMRESREAALEAQGQGSPVRRTDTPSPKRLVGSPMVRGRR